MTRPWRLRVGGLALAALLAPFAPPSAAAADAPRVPNTMAQRVLACTGCHAAQDRRSATEYVPRIAGKPADYLHRQLLNFRDGQRQHTTMARLLQGLPDDYLREIAAHFAALPAPAHAGTALPAGAAAARARTLVHDGDRRAGVPACAACHGASLTGVRPALPGLLGLPRDYLVAQLGAWRVGARSARAPDCMADIARRLSESDIAALADWLAAQPLAAGALPAAPDARALPLRCGAVEVPPAPEPAPTRPASDAGTVARGAYLARLGHCAGCHTAPGGTPYAGGRAIATSFGTVWAGNLTPDESTGLGRWSADDFWRALHEGRSRDGRVLTPAFPYTEYTRIRREDSDALFAYLRSLPAVQQAPRAHALRFPFGTQPALHLWRALYFRPGVQIDDPARSAAWNRGAYLVQGLGHCAACHAPRGGLGGGSGVPSGGRMPGEPWWAPSLLDGGGHGGDRAALVALLRHGRSPLGSGSGPMADVVRGSTQHWSDDDLDAVATYLLDRAPPRAAFARPAARAEPAALQRGARLYERACADCHGARGQGVPGVYPPLAGNPSVLQPSAVNLVQVVRRGAFAVATAAHPRPYGMPPTELRDDELADLLTFLRQGWGHGAGPVDALDVLRMR